MHINVYPAMSKNTGEPEYLETLSPQVLSLTYQAWCLGVREFTAVPEAPGAQYRLRLTWGWPGCLCVGQGLCLFIRALPLRHGAFCRRVEDYCTPPRVWVQMALLLSFCQPSLGVWQPSFLPWGRCLPGSRESRAPHRVLWHMKSVLYFLPLCFAVVLPQGYDL